MKQPVAFLATVAAAALLSCATPALTQQGSGTFIAEPKATGSSEERARQLEGARHLVPELDLGTRAGGPAADDGVAEQRQPGVTSPDLVLQLVDTLLQVAQTDGVGRPGDRLLGGGPGAHVHGDCRRGRSRAGWNRG